MFITITRYQRTNEKKLQQQQRNNKNNNKETFIIKIPNPTGGFIGAIAVDKKGT
jgi:isoaspartyl peptidase/L-asparaginase-like protein (Ntn-hydrolase superfamily)